MLAPLEVFRWVWTKFVPYDELRRAPTVTVVLLTFLTAGALCGTSSVWRTSTWITAVSFVRSGISLWRRSTLTTRRCWNRWWTRRTESGTARARRPGRGPTACRSDAPCCPPHSKKPRVCLTSCTFISRWRRVQSWYYCRWKKLYFLVVAPGDYKTVTLNIFSLIKCVQRYDTHLKLKKTVVPSVEEVSRCCIRGCTAEVPYVEQSRKPRIWT